MEDLLAGVLEFLGDLLVNALRGIKNPRKRKWALTIFYATIALLFSCVLLFLTITAYKEISLVGTLVLSGMTGLWMLASGFYIIRQHRKN